MLQIHLLIISVKDSVRCAESFIVRLQKNAILFILNTVNYNIYTILKKGATNMVKESCNECELQSTCPKAAHFENYYFLSFSMC